MKIGIIEWHGDLLNIMKHIIPESDTTIVYDKKTTQINEPLDILINGAHNGTFNEPEHHTFPFNFFAVPYASVTELDINQWNSNPKCIGVLDVSNSLKARFPSLKKPVWG